jgi:hypothetical protein
MTTKQINFFKKPRNMQEIIELFNGDIYAANSFQSIGLIGRELKSITIDGRIYFILYNSKPIKIRYKVKTETKGILVFEELPENTYFTIGNVGNEPQSKPGEAYLFINDNGTCLIPIKDIKTGEQVIIPENSGKQIKNGELIPA